MRIAVSRDFRGPDGQMAMGDLGLPLLSARGGITWAFFSEHHDEVRPADIRGYDALILAFPRITRRSLEGADRLALIVRWGVGYDRVDVKACTEAGVGVAITPDGPRRGVGYATLTMLLALATRLPEKERLIRQGRWHERGGYVGSKITGQVLGSVGFGRNAREMFHLAGPFGMTYLAHDPWVNPEVAAALGVELVDLPTLLRCSDFLAVHCPLTPETRGLIAGAALAQMKPAAFVINMARGGIVDEGALAEAIQNGRLAGAGVDVFDEEPPATDHPLFSLDRVIVTPHSLAWTEELYADNGRGVAAAILSLARGEVPAALVNPQVRENPRFQARLTGGTAR